MQGIFRFHDISFADFKFGGECPRLPHLGHSASAIIRKSRVLIYPDHNATALEGWRD